LAVAMEGTMGRFRFRLARVCRVREQQQRQAEQVVAGSQRALRRERESLSEVEQAAESIRLRCAREGAGPLRSTSLLPTTRHLELLGAKEASQRKRVAVAAQQLAEDQSGLRAAMQAREVLDRLRQTRLTEHRRDALAAEERETDAVVTSRWSRSDMSSCPV
jgi:flagellar export protein FliJ